MLQMILSDKNLFVDPEILAELSEDQRQTLFYKIREEQKRRWCVAEGKGKSPKISTKKTAKKKKNYSKKVDFRKGSDGNDWVWLMGEGPGDKSWDVIVESYAKIYAEQKAEKAALEIKQCEQTKLINTVKERENLIKNDSAIGQEQRTKELAELKKMEQTKMGQIVEEARRASMSMTAEILLKKNNALQNVRRKQEDSRWHDIVMRGRQADKRRRSMHKQAERDARNSIMDMDPSDLETLDKLLADRKLGPKNNNKPAGVSVSPIRPPRRRRPMTPANRDDVIDWFREIETLRSAGQDSGTGKIEPWFHGILTQAEAETILCGGGVGSFLVRVLLKAWGYAISYKSSVDTVVHYVVDTSGGTYQLFGKASPPHITLSELIKYYQTVPLCCENDVVLSTPVGQSSTMFADYDEFFKDVFDTKL